MKSKKKIAKSVNRNIVFTPDAPKAIGPYSQGVALKKLVFFSGQLGIDPQTGKLCGTTCSEQTQQVLKNIDALLSSQGLTAANVVKTTVFLTDMANFSEMNTAYAEYFNFEPPARSCIAVAALPMNALVEIEMIATL
ncbi:MAG: RidA family protein [Clostridiales bacterium]|nr:RidA family protein [Clostridiales bacterium]